MSVFYNFKLNASRNIKSLAQFETFGGDGAIVSNQSEYEVGVNRFKIPLSDIPLYRIYENDLLLCFSNRGGNAFTALGVQNGKVNLANVARSVFNGDCLWS